MNKVIFYLTVTIILSCKSDKTENKTFRYDHSNEQTVNSEIINNQDTSLFKIVRIDSFSSYYLIYAKKNNSYYKILSIDDAYKPKCHNLKLHGSYDLELKSLVPDTSKSPILLKGIGYRGIEVDFEGDSIRDVYKSYNLNGLCYSTSKKDSVSNWLFKKI